MGIPIPGAYASPRISNGVLCWYAGDTFSVVIQADLVDQDGAAVDIGATDTVKITFRDDTRAEVWSKTFSNVANNQVTGDACGRRGDQREVPEGQIHLRRGIFARRPDDAGAGQQSPGGMR